MYIEEAIFTVARVFTCVRFRSVGRAAAALDEAAEDLAGPLLLLPPVSSSVSCD
jgi:hypothetical protein